MFSVLNKKKMKIQENDLEHKGTEPHSKVEAPNPVHRLVRDTD